MKEQRIRCASWAGVTLPQRGDMYVVALLDAALRSRIAWAWLFAPESRAKAKANFSRGQPTAAAFERRVDPARALLMSGQDYRRSDTSFQSLVASGVSSNSGWANLRRPARAKHVSTRAHR